MELVDLPQNVQEDTTYDVEFYDLTQQVEEDVVYTLVYTYLKQ